MFQQFSYNCEKRPEGGCFSKKLCKVTNLFGSSRVYQRTECNKNMAATICYLGGCHIVAGITWNAQARLFSSLPDA